MAFGKPKAPKEPKPPKAPKEKKPKKPKKEKPPKEKKPPKAKKPPKPKKPKKGKNAPEAVDGMEEEPQKKKLPLPFLIISLAVIVAAAVIVFLFVIKPMFFGGADADPDASASLEPQPPELPTEIPIGDDVTIKGMTLEADESGALVEKSKTVTYTYTSLVNAGKAAQTYAGQLAGESPRFSVVDEEFVIQRETPDYTTEEGMVLLARDVPAPAPEATAPPAAESPEGTEDPDAGEEPTPTPEPDPEPTEEPVTYVHTVRITWSPGVCVVTADEQEGKVTSPPPAAAAAQHPVTQRGAVKQLEKLSPAQLGLPGASMELYEVIPMDATKTVNGAPCIWMHVYSDKNVPNSNEFMGSYLMTIDAEHLYRVDPITNEITELEYEYMP